MIQRGSSTAPLYLILFQRYIIRLSIITQTTGVQHVNAYRVYYLFSVFHAGDADEERQPVLQILHRKCITRHGGNHHAIYTGDQ